MCDEIEGKENNGQFIGKKREKEKGEKEKKVALRISKS